jgi:hypothetical protein
MVSVLVILVFSRRNFHSFLCTFLPLHRPEIRAWIRYLSEAAIEKRDLILTASTRPDAVLITHSTISCLPHSILPHTKMCYIGLHNASRKFIRDGRRRLLCLCIRHSIALIKKKKTWTDFNNYLLSTTLEQRVCSHTIITELNTPMHETKYMYLYN